MINLHDIPRERTTSIDNINIILRVNGFNSITEALRNVGIQANMLNENLRRILNAQPPRHP